MESDLTDIQMLGDAVNFEYFWHTSVSKDVL